VVSVAGVRVVEFGPKGEHPKCNERPTGYSDQK